MTHTTAQPKILLGLFLWYRTYQNYVIISRYRPDSYCATPICRPSHIQTKFKHICCEWNKRLVFFFKQPSVISVSCGLGSGEGYENILAIKGYQEHSDIHSENVRNMEELRLFQGWLSHQNPLLRALKRTIALAPGNTFFRTLRHCAKQLGGMFNICSKALWSAADFLQQTMGCVGFDDFYLLSL